MNLAKEYIVLGLVGLLIAAGLYFIGYSVIYKKRMKGEKTITKRTAVLSGILLFYLIFVLGATLLNRGSAWSGSFNLRPFSSYRSAWNNFSMTEWRNIVLNIVLFVPLGFLLPLLSQRFKTFWKTAVAGFCVTLIIECVQMPVGRGIFEIDDIIDNTAGVIIGYGIIMIFYTAKSNVKNKAGKILGYLSPLILASAVFMTIFITYDKQEFGNMRENYSYRINMSNVNVITNKQMSKSEGKALVFSTDVATPNETLAFARQFFANLGTDIDEKRNNVYENTIVYYDIGGKFSLWVNFKGLTYRFTNFEEIQSKVDDSADEETIRLALKKYGVIVPDNAGFTPEGKGQYTFDVHDVRKNSGMIDGTLTCNYSANGNMKEIRNNIVDYRPVRQANIISEQEAYDRIKQGKFSSYADKINEIIINDVTLGYSLDSKGFYQPVYEFDAQVDGNKVVIAIPALEWQGYCVKTSKITRSTAKSGGHD